MILDLLGGLFLPIIEGLIDLLPEVDPIDVSGGGWGQLVSMLGTVDSFVPILPGVVMAGAIFSAVVVFVVVRLIMIVINVVTW
jgi:hypothetical protein